MDIGSLLVFGGLFKNNDPKITFIMTCMYIIYTISKDYIDKSKIENFLQRIFSDFFSKSNMISIELISHKVQYTKGYSDKPLSKDIFSPQFLGVLHFLKQNKKKIKNLKNMTEMLINKIGDITRPSWKEDNSKDDKFLLIPENKESICLDEELDIHLTISLIINEDDNKTENKTYTLKIFTYHDNRMNYIEEKNKLYDYLDNITKEYEHMFDDKDDEKKYIYEYSGSESCDDEANLKYNKYIMEHNKDLNRNIFFEDKQKMIDYITPFIFDKNKNDNKGMESYINSGMTFKAGLLFYGSPGCGKTSTIKGILKYTNRHAVIINLSNIQSNEELENVFRNRKINEKTYSGHELCFILEDCDATKLSSIKERNETPVIIPKIESNVGDKKDIIDFKSIMPKGFDLSCFLNVLDGIIELHGIMIIMTTNHPEKLDEALIRPGRIDFKYEFKKTNVTIIKKMLKLKYCLTDEKINSYKDFKNMKDYVLSPAEIQSICFKNNNIENCIKNILLTSQIN